MLGRMWSKWRNTKRLPSASPRVRLKAIPHVLLRGWPSSEATAPKAKAHRPAIHHRSHPNAAVSHSLSKAEHYFFWLVSFVTFVDIILK